MESFSTLITEFLISVPIGLQLIVISLSSFFEGLPVIGSILPGGTIAIFAGTLVNQGVLPLFFTILIIGLSSFAGDMVGFFIGKKFKNISWVRKIIENEKHQKNWDLFDRHIMIITIFGKLIPVVRSTPSIIAAARGIKSRKYILYSFIGSVLWAFVGVYAGNFIEKFLGKNSMLVIFLIIVFSVLFVSANLFIKRVVKKKKILN